MPCISVTYLRVSNQVWGGALIKYWQMWLHQHALLLSPADCSEENPCEGLSRHATFTNFGMAFLTLFRVSTGDNWNGIMKVCAVCVWVLASLCRYIDTDFK